jgi:hypothetical protein
VTQREINIFMETAEKKESVILKEPSQVTESGEKKIIAVEQEQSESNVAEDDEKDMDISMETNDDDVIVDNQT